MNGEKGTVKKQRSEEGEDSVKQWNEQWRSEEGMKAKKEVKERSLNVWCDVLGFG